MIYSDVRLDNVKTQN